MRSRIEQAIEDIFDFVNRGKTPLSNQNKVILQKAELYDLLDELQRKTPEEIKKYQKIINNRDKIIEDATRNAAMIVEQANQHAAALIDESEMVRTANQRAQEIITAATQEADRIISMANEEAGQIRVGAISYTNDLLTNAESILMNAYKNTQSRYKLVFEALEEDLQIIKANKSELEMELPREVAASETEQELPATDEQLEELLEDNSEDY